MTVTLGSSRIRFTLKSYFPSFAELWQNTDVQQSLSGFLTSKNSRINKSRHFVKEELLLPSNEKSDEQQHHYQIEIVPSNEEGDAFVPYIGFTAILPLVLSFFFFSAQARIVREENEKKQLFDWKFMIWLVSTAVEVILFVSMAIPPFLIKFSALFGTPRPHKRLLGNKVPSVDILVTSCREEPSVVKNTLLAALAIDYPSDKFRVILADDGSSTELQSWVTELGSPNLYYTQRHKRTGFKAGNLNHAVLFSKLLPGPPTEFIAAIDADMIVDRQWLRTVAAHIVSDGSTGLVCPAQYFYNTPINDPLYQSNTVCWRGRHLFQDYAGMGWNTGSGYILRRRALEEIGGFPTACLTEDVQTSMLMMAKGWNTTYIRDKLQYGLLPESWYGHIKQYTRWNVGGCQLALHFKLYFSSKRTGKLSLWIRAIGFSYGVSDMVSSVLRTISLVTLPIRLLLGIPMVYFYTPEQMAELLRLQCAVVLAGWIHELHLAQMIGYRVAIREAAMSTLMAPYYASSFLQNCVLPMWLGGVTPGFTPTGSIPDTLQERSAHHRAPLSTRLYTALFKTGMWIHALILLSVCSAAIYRIQRILSENGYHQHAGSRISPQCTAELLKYIAWPPFSLILCLSANLDRILYIVFPPDVPEREELLGPREDSGARYPTQAARKVQWKRWLSFEYATVSTCAMAYTAGIYWAIWN